jgi:hypothetical protein
MANRAAEDYEKLRVKLERLEDTWVEASTAYHVTTVDSAGNDTKCLC